MQSSIEEQARLVARRELRLDFSVPSNEGRSISQDASKDAGMGEESPVDRTNRFTAPCSDRCGIQEPECRSGGWLDVEGGAIAYATDRTLSGGKASGVPASVCPRI